MKMYKRLLSVILAISILFVLPAFTQAEETETANNAEYTRLVEKLGSFGVWSLEKNANDVINRGEFAKIMASVLNSANEAKADSAFVDVDITSPYYNAVSYMKSSDIMKGIDAERFAPLRTITYNEALKTVLTVLGYSDRAEIKGGYPAGYVNIGISLGFNVNPGELTAYEAVKMIDHAVFKVRLMTVIGYGGDNVSAIVGPTGNKTVLNQYHNLFIGKGKLTDNGLTELYQITSINPDDSMVKIDDVPYFYNGGTDIRRALNSTIDYYYKEENGARTILWWEYSYAERDEIVVYAEDIIKDSPKLTKTQFVYRDGNKTKTVKINPRAAFIFNEIAFPTFTVADLKPQEGWFTMIDENGDGEIDIIFAEVYENYFVVSESNNGEIFSDRFFRSLDTSKFDRVEAFNALGEDIFNDPSNKINAKDVYEADRAAGSPARAVAANNVISVFKSKTNAAGEGRYLKIILSDATITDTLNEMETYDEKCICTVGTKQYEMNDFLLSKVGVDNSLSELRFGERYRFYLDYRGEITYFEAISAINQYAYLLAAGKENEGLKSDVEMKLVLETGEIAILPIADEVILNGIKTKETAVMDNADIQKEKQLIRMKLNGKGEIREINTATTLCNTPLYKGVGYDPTKFSMVMDTTNSKPMGNNRYIFSGSVYAYDAETILFYLPSSGREEDIRVYKGIAGADKLKGAYKVKGYDADNVLTMNAVTLEDMADTAATDYGAYYSYVHIVKEIKNTVNEYGEDVKQIKAWCYDFDSKIMENEPGILPADVKVGDILRLQLNADERIIKADKILSTMDDFGQSLSPEERSEPFAYIKSDKTKSKFSSWGESILYGYPVGRNTSGITIATGNPAGTRVNFIPFYVPGIVFFDVKNLDCSVAGRTAIPVTATLDEVNNRFNINNEDIAVLVTTQSSGMYDCIIIQY